MAGEVSRGVTLFCCIRQLENEIRKMLHILVAKELNSELTINNYTIASSL